MAFRPEPAYQHGRKAGTAIVLCNLGTPDAPTPEAVRSYLREFLGDPRVVEIPPMLWKVSTRRWRRLAAGYSMHA